MKLTLTDEELAKVVKEFMSRNENATRRDVIEKCRTSLGRLQKLEKDGMIPSIPEPLSRSVSATRGRNKTPWSKFKLPGSPNFRHI